MVDKKSPIGCSNRMFGRRTSLFRGWLVGRTEPSPRRLVVWPHSCGVFGCPPRTFRLYPFIHLPSSIPHDFVFSIFTSLSMQDGLIQAWRKDPCVIHSKLTSMHATKQDIISYWANNKDNQTRLSARFEHASHHSAPALHTSSPSPKQSITPRDKHRYSAVNTSLDTS